MRVPIAGDYIKTVSPQFVGVWRGKIRRQDGDLYLIEWSYAGGFPIDICTWVADTDIAIVRRPKVTQKCF